MKEAIDSTTLPFVNRRQVLRGAAAVAAGAIAVGAAPAFAASGRAASGYAGDLPKGESLPPSPIRLGIASYTFRKFDKARLIDFMHQLNTPYLNLKDAHLPLTPLDQVKGLADEYRAAGLKLTAAGTIYFTKDDDADIRPKFEYMKAAGIPVMVCMPSKNVVPSLEKYVKEYDIKLAIHNHGTEDKNFPSPLDVLAAVKNMDPRIGCCIDVGHTERAGTDVVQAIHAVGPRLFDVHMKDLTDFGSKESQVAVGDGIMPVPEIFKALMEIKYPGDVDLEYEIHADDPMPGVVKSFAYMRGVLAGMGYKG